MNGSVPHAHSAHSIGSTTGCLHASSNTRSRSLTPSCWSMSACRLTRAPLCIVTARCSTSRTRLETTRRCRATRANSGQVRGPSTGYAGCIQTAGRRIELWNATGSSRPRRKPWRISATSLLPAISARPTRGGSNLCLSNAVAKAHILAGTNTSRQRQRSSKRRHVTACRGSKRNGRPYNCDWFCCMKSPGPLKGCGLLQSLSPAGRHALHHRAQATTECRYLAEFLVLRMSHLPT